MKDHWSGVAFVWWGQPPFDGSPDIGALGEAWFFGSRGSLVREVGVALRGSTVEVSGHRVSAGVEGFQRKAVRAFALARCCVSRDKSGLILRSLWTKDF